MMNCKLNNKGNEKQLFYSITFRIPWDLFLKKCFVLKIILVVVLAIPTYQRKIVAVLHQKVSPELFIHNKSSVNYDVSKKLSITKVEMFT